MLGPHDKDLLLQQWNAEQCLAETTYPQKNKKVYIKTCHLYPGLQISYFRQYFNLLKT